MSKSKCAHLNLQINEVVSSEYIWSCVNGQFRSLPTTTEEKRGAISVYCRDCDMLRSYPRNRVPRWLIERVRKTASPTLSRSLWVSPEEEHRQVEMELYADQIAAYLDEHYPSWALKKKNLSPSWDEVLVILKQQESMKIKEGETFNDDGDDNTDSV